MAENKNESKINFEGMPADKLNQEEQSKDQSSNEKQQEKIKKPQVKKSPKMEASNEQNEALLKLKNDLLTALAENQNLRKRHLKEREELTKFATSSALSELASPFENLFTALKIELPEDLKQNEFIKSMLDGILMVQKDFERVFAKLGLTRIYPEGAKFDPNLHQAVAQVETSDVEAGFVVQVVSAGFDLNGRVLKPAMVVVAK